MQIQDLFDKHPFSRLLMYGFVVISLSYGLLSLYRIITTTAPDFTVYYGAAQLLVSGKSLSGNTGLFTGFGYPPTTLLLFLPFLLLPYQIAQGLWISLSFLLIPLSVVLCFLISGKGTTGRTFVEQCLVWSSLFFWSFPTRFTLGMGQVNLVSLTFLLGGVYVLQIKRSRWSVLLFTLLLISKPHFVLLLPFLFLAGFRRVSIETVVLYGLATFGTAITFGVWQFTNYFQKEVPQLLVFTGREIYYNQSLGGFFSRIFLPTVAKNLTQLVSVILLGGLGVVEGSGGLEKRKTNVLLHLLTFFLPIFILVEPLGWQHHFVFILPVYLLLWKQHRSVYIRTALMVSFLLISWNIRTPLQYFGFWNQLIILSHGFWGIVLLLVVSILLHHHLELLRSKPQQ